MQTFNFSCQSISIITKSGTLEGGDSVEISATLKLQSPRAVRPKVGEPLERSRWILTITTATKSYESEIGPSVGRATRLAPRSSESPTTYYLQVALNPTQFYRVFQLAISELTMNAVDLLIQDVEEEGFDAVAWGAELPAERKIVNFEATWETKSPDTSGDEVGKPIA